MHGAHSLYLPSALLAHELPLLQRPWLSARKMLLSTSPEEAEANHPSPALVLIVQVALWS